MTFLKKKTIGNSSLSIHIFPFVLSFPLIPLKSSYFLSLVLFQLQKVSESLVSCSLLTRGSNTVFILCGRRMKSLRGYKFHATKMHGDQKKGDDLSDRGRDEKEALHKTGTHQQSGARFLPQLWRLYLCTQSSRGNLGRRREARSSTKRSGYQN